MRNLSLSHHSVWRHTIRSQAELGKLHHNMHSIHVIYHEHHNAAPQQHKLVGIKMCFSAQATHPPNATAQVQLWSFSQRWSSNCGEQRLAGSCCSMQPRKDLMLCSSAGSVHLVPSSSSPDLNVVHQLRRQHRLAVCPAHAPTACQACPCLSWHDLAHIALSGVIPACHATVDLQLHSSL